MTTFGYATTGFGRGFKGAFRGTARSSLRVHIMSLAQEQSGADETTVFAVVTYQGMKE